MTDIPLLEAIHHLKLPVADLERSLAWYQSRLGYEVVMEFVEDGVLMGLALTHPNGGPDLADGFIPGEQHGPGGPWRIRIDAELRAKIAPEIPDGRVGLAEAAQRLGAARQTVLDRIRRGELDAVHVNRGQRKGLAIEIPATDALFADAR